MHDTWNVEQQYATEKKDEYNRLADQQRLLQVGLISRMLSVAAEEDRLKKAQTKTRLPLGYVTQKPSVGLL